MKPIFSATPPVAAEVTRRTRNSIHQPPPRVGGYAVTLLCAAALFTHTVFAAKPPPSPPPPQPSSGTLVLDYAGPDGSGADNWGLVVAPTGTIYALGNDYALDPNWGQLVLGSSD